MNRIKAYFSLTKPRLTAGNLLIAAAAFVFGSPLAFNWTAFMTMLIGLAAVIGSACVYNNVYDRDIDAHMERTRSRATVTGQISKGSAIAFGAILLALGVWLLWRVNAFALGSSIAGWLSYVLLYTPLKHRSSLALYVGAVAGATPPLVGYAAAMGTLDWYAAGLFGILYLWQLPHFLAIARYRYGEYTAAGVPLAVSAPKNDAARRHARGVFYMSLVLLVAISAALILQRWIR